jgi:hypothetical protein
MGDVDGRGRGGDRDNHREWDEGDMSTVGTKANPMLVRIVTDSNGGLRVGRLLLAVGMTAGLAWLSVAIQRGMSGPDVGRTVKMRGASLVKDYAYARADYWGALGARAATVYQQARAL